MARNLSLRLLDRFGLFDDQGPVPVPAGSERVLALLAVDGRTLGRVRLAGALWPHTTDRRAQACLRSALRRLPARARAAVSVDPAVVALSAGVLVDMRAAQQLAHRLIAPAGRPTEADLDAATIATLTSELLPDWYEDWVVSAAEGWRQLRMHALEALADHLASSGRYGEAIEAALAAVGADPLRESARRALIRVHLAEGNRSEALREFDRYRRLLGTELGLQPTAALHRLVDLPTGPVKIRSA
ncbi:MAG TPA: BTAD domain-containing putative transcriptional regulator [Kribbellaceae bacterium]|nr:BTAD domain-containing putative transcriptional regulator [Kribbellaceae bacterium]